MDRNRVRQRCLLLSPTGLQVKGIPVNRIDKDTYQIETTA
jgi:hypothetical protein